MEAFIRSFGTSSWGLQPFGAVLGFELGAPIVAGSLTGLACFATCAIVLRGYNRRIRRAGNALTREGAWLLSSLLAVCGASQFVSAFAALPLFLPAGLALAAAITCWAAVLALVPLWNPGPTDRDQSRYQREIVKLRRAEEALRNVESEARKLAEADVRKNEFLAMLGHELRNPLAPIRNAVKIMKQRGSDDPDLCWARNVVDHQVRQMAQLVDDLLEISRVTSGKVRLQQEPVDVATIVAFAVETSRPTIDARNHRLSIALPARPVLVNADPLRMAQVLSNLLNNAAKYTKPGGQIRLAAKTERDEVVFRVRDTGIGIPPEMLSTIFELFTQVDHSLDHSEGGLGLGLTVVKSLVEMHGGSVQAQSAGLGRGSEFIVRLPASADAPLKVEPAHGVPPANQPAGTDAAGPSRRVLVVDDNVGSAQSMAMVLKLEGHDVQVAHDGDLALEAVRRFRPEVVLMDIGLPGVDGYEVAHRIRHDPELQAGIELLVAITGYAEDDARRRSHEAGFDHHFVKPVDPDSVLTLLSSREWSDEQAGFPLGAQAL